MVLEAKNISFHYLNNDWLFKNISVKIESGERVGILAPSGYGKSTFSNILSGNLMAQEGSVLLDGMPINKIQGFCPVQIVYQHPEKALNPRWTMERSLNEAYVPSEPMKENFGIQSKWLSRWPNELSGGELQRFCLLRLLSPELKFLIADEISTMLDAITQAQIWTALLDIVKEQNMGLIIISHNKELINRVCTRTIDMQNM